MFNAIVQDIQELRAPTAWRVLWVNEYHLLLQVLCTILLHHHPEPWSKNSQKLLYIMWNVNVTFAYENGCCRTICYCICSIQVEWWNCDAVNCKKYTFVSKIKPQNLLSPRFFSAGGLYGCVSLCKKEFLCGFSLEKVVFQTFDNQKGKERRTKRLKNEWKNTQFTLKSDKFVIVIKTWTIRESSIKWKRRRRRRK